MAGILINVLLATLIGYGLIRYLVPSALIALNICPVHVICTYAAGSWDNYGHPATLTGAPLALGSALLLKHRGLLVCSTVGYLALLLYGF